MIKAYFHHHLLLLLCFPSLFLVSINAQRYGSYGYGSGAYGANWGSGYGSSKTQPTYGYGENRNGDRQNGWTGIGGGQWGQNQQQNWGQNQQENNQQQQGAVQDEQQQQFGQQYPSHWPQQQQQRGQQFTAPPSQEETENNWDNKASSPQKGGKFQVQLPPGAPGTSEATDAVQSNK